MVVVSRVRCGHGAPMNQETMFPCVRGSIGRMELDEGEIAARVHISFDLPPGATVYADASPGASWEWVWLRSGVAFLWTADPEELP